MDGSTLQTDLGPCLLKVALLRDGEYSHHPAKRTCGAEAPIRPTRTRDWRDLNQERSGCTSQTASAGGGNVRCIHGFNNSYKDQLPFLSV